MSEPLRIALVGATGLIGRTVIEQCVGRTDICLFAIARREMPLPVGARMEMHIADPAQWGNLIGAIRPAAMISALGTTWAQAGKDEDAFRAVDERLVLVTARAAKVHGVRNFVAVSSAGANSLSRNFYLKVKGEVEGALRQIGFDRLDILRPGLLRGERDGDRRLGERIGIIAAPITDLLMQGKYRAYRSVRAEDVAQAALALAMRKAKGKFVHDPDAIQRAAAGLPVA
ncbi:NAD(P)H-binding protein [Tsuneonella flava]|uniref:NAD(P)H-binding protein n=1 Tax=Tsuneonella flava TaxID=2055955 RepID=A0ABX7KAP9_9SPHN|nr:NAD(P)H-binding protein [Tsuneonella flava]QSB43585.1 NAD(P)H-binding protein [Tsuneonella flava]